MGNTQGAGFLSPEEVEQYKELTRFSEEDLKRLHRRFRRIDTDGSGSLTIDEFAAIPDLAANPLLHRILDIFDENKDNQIEFKEFVKVYDIDNDGFISNGELYMVLKMMVGDNLTAEQLQQVVDKTILEADEDQDGRISYEEFKNMVQNKDEIAKKMSFTF